MAEQSGRQPFRFRIPWITNPAPAPAPTASRPPTLAQITQTPTTVRPPFRPPGVAPPRSSSQPQVPPLTGARPPSPTRTASRPPSPAKNVPSQPPASPIKPIDQPQVTSQPSSPIRKGPSQPQSPVKPAWRPPSPSRTALSQPETPVSQGQTTEKAEAQPTSPIQQAPQPRVASQTSSPMEISRDPPQTPTKSESRPISTSQISPQYQVKSQPSSPSKTTPYQPQIPQRTASLPPSPPPLKISKPQNVSQPPSPSHTAFKPQTTQNSPLNSASLTTTQPTQAFQPPSPSHVASQLEAPTQKTSQPPSPLVQAPAFQPPSPSHVASQLEAPTQKTSQPPSPLVQAPRSQLTTPAPTREKSPPRSSELPSTKMATLQETSPPSEKIYQPALKTALPSVAHAVTGGPSQYPAQRPELDEFKQAITESKLEDKEKSNKQTEDARKQITLPGLHKDSVSNLQPKDQVGTSEDNKKQEHAQQNEESAKVARGKERKHNLHQIRADTEVHLSAFQGEASQLHKQIRDNISKSAHNISRDRPQNISDKNPVSVITIAGENTGATMHLGTESARKESSIHIHRGYQHNPEDISEATTDGGNSARRRFKNPKTKEDAAGTIYVNSNTQSVNNSIMMSNSLSEGSPGVHVSFTHFMDEPTKSNGRAGSIEARKADFNVTPSQKLTYEPTVKRRCLRGLFLESSDSDPDNPNKPRRHGCHYDCKEKQKGKENGNDR